MTHKTTDGTRATFTARKGFHAINLQAIADTDGRIIYCDVGNVPGCAHDSFFCHVPHLGQTEGSRFAALAYERGRVEAAARTLGCPPGGAPCSHAAAAVVAVTEAELSAAAAEHLPRPSTLSRIISGHAESAIVSALWPNGTR